VQRADTQQGIAGGVAPQGRVRGEVVCRFCGSDKVNRLYREGFLQTRIYPLFGFYPWRCKVCAGNMMLHKRMKAKQAAPPA
jgi:hypothetical protein